MLLLGRWQAKQKNYKFLFFKNQNHTTISLRLNVKCLDASILKCFSALVFKCFSVLVFL